MTDKQPNIAQMLQPGGIVPIDITTTAALVAEVNRQHAALERKDALLRQALGALSDFDYDKRVTAVRAITKELQ